MSWYYMLLLIITSDEVLREVKFFLRSDYSTCPVNISIKSTANVLSATLTHDGHGWFLHARYLTHYTNVKNNVGDIKPSRILEQLYPLNNQLSIRLEAIFYGQWSEITTCWPTLWTSTRKHFWASAFHLRCRHNLHNSHQLRPTCRRHNNLHNLVPRLFFTARK